LNAQRVSEEVDDDYAPVFRRIRIAPDEVDHGHYFRDDVFSHLHWLSRSKTVHEAFAKFQIAQ
jgi:hypothetical protein